MLPGYAPAAGRYGKSAPRVPKLSLSELDAALKRFLIEDYNRQPHSVTGIAPQERWHGNSFLPRMPESLEQLDLLLLTVVQPRRVQQDGIRFQGFRYIDPVLAAYVSEWVTIRYDPLDEQRNPARPWLTIIIDDYSRAIAGYFLSLKDPSALQTALALRQAIWRKAEPGWQVCGIPDVLYTDNGSDFISHHIEQVCADLKIRAVFSLPGKPRGRGRIERFFRTVNQRCLSMLPGYAPATGRYGKSAPRVPALTLSELDEALKRFFIEDYNRQPHSVTGIAPQERWHGTGFLPRMPASLEQLDLLLLTVVQPRRVQQDGIRFQRFRYIDPVLAAYVGEWVTIRYDPRDMAEIRVYHRDEFVCRAVCQELAGETVSLREIIGARRRRTRELRQVIKERHALYGQTFPIPHVQHQMPEIRPVESQLEAATPSKSSLKHYECD